MLNITEKNNVIRIIQIPILDRLLYLLVIIPTIYWTIIGEKLGALFYVAASLAFLIFCFKIIKYDIPTYINKSTKTITKGFTTLKFSDIKLIKEDVTYELSLDQYNSTLTGNVEIVTKNNKRIALNGTGTFFADYNRKGNKIVMDMLTKLTGAKLGPSIEDELTKTVKEQNARILKRLPMALLQVTIIAIIIYIALIILFKFI